MKKALIGALVVFTMTGCGMNAGVSISPDAQNSQAEANLFGIKYVLTAMNLDLDSLSADKQKFVMVKVKGGGNHANNLKFGQGLKGSGAFVPAKDGYIYLLRSDSVYVNGRPQDFTELYRVGSFDLRDYPVMKPGDSFKFKLDRGVEMKSERDQDSLFLEKSYWIQVTKPLTQVQKQPEFFPAN